MSSSDASDLVDSDESGVAEPPRKKRVLIRRSSTSTPGAKKPRLARSADGEAAAAGLGRTRGDACVFHCECACQEAHARCKLERHGVDRSIITFCVQKLTEKQL